MSPGMIKSKKVVFSRAPVAKVAKAPPLPLEVPISDNQGLLPGEVAAFKSQENIDLKEGHSLCLSESNCLG